MIKRGDKRGSHVEIIISFAIFVTFIFFIFSIIEPSIKTQNDKDNILNNLEYEIIDRTSADMTIATVNLVAGGSNCVDLTDLIFSLETGDNIIVKDNKGETVSSNIHGTSLQVNRGSTSDTFFKIYYSEEFDALVSGSGCPSIGYVLGLTKTERYVFESKLIVLLDEDYSTLKNNLKIPAGVEFGYGIKLSNGTTIETETEELSTSIYVRQTPIKYVDTDGNILMGFLETKIW